MPWPHAAMDLGDALAAHSHGLVFMAAVWLLWPHAAMDLIALAMCGHGFSCRGHEAKVWLPWLCVAIVLVALAECDHGFGCHGWGFADSEFSEFS